MRRLAFVLLCVALIISLRTLAGTKVEPMWFPYLLGKGITVAPPGAKGFGVYPHRGAISKLSTLEAMVVVPFIDLLFGEPAYAGFLVERLFETGITRRNLFEVYDRRYFEVLKDTPIVFHEIKKVAKELRASGVSGILYGFVKAYRELDESNRPVSAHVNVCAYLVDTASLRIMWSAEGRLSSEDLARLLETATGERKVAEALSVIDPSFADIIDGKVKARSLSASELIDCELLLTIVVGNLVLDLEEFYSKSRLVGFKK